MAPGKDRNRGEPPVAGAAKLLNLHSANAQKGHTMENTSDRIPGRTYTLRFTHCDSSEIEEFLHTRESDAREHFALFTEEDADIYSRIDLIQYDWDTGTETLLSSQSF